MAKVRGKMYVSKVARYAWNTDATEIELKAVSQGEENKAWAAATPNATLTMTVLNEVAANLLADQLGQEVFVDIFPAGEYPPDAPVE